MMRRTTLRSAAAFLLLFALLTGCLTSCKGKETEVTLSVLDLPEDLDPQTTEDPAAEMVLINCMEGLTRRDAKGQIQLAAADRVTVSEDQCTWRFHLKDSAWSDGKKVGPEDFVFAFWRLFDPATGAQEDAKAFSALKNADQILQGKLPVGNIGVWAEKEDVVFSLTRPEPEFMELLASVRAMPCRRDFFEKTAGSYGLGRKDLLYNGPYVIRYWLEGEYLILGANSHHGGDGLLNRQVIFQLASSEEEIFAQFEAEKTNLCFGRKSLLDAADERTYSGMLFEDQVFCLAFQTENGPMQDKTLRQALLLSLRREAIPEENTGGYARATGILPGALSERPSVPFLSYNPQKARALLAAYLKKEGLEKLGALTVTMPETGFHREMLSLLQQVWQTELGVYVNLEILPEEQWKEALAAGDYELALLPVTAKNDDTPALLSEFLPGGVYNTFGFESRRFAEDLKRAEKAVGEEQQALLAACVQELQDSLAITPLYGAQGACVYAKELEGLEISPFGRRIYFASAGREQAA